MSYKDEKIVTVLLDEVKNAEVRCLGYHDELSEALAEIVQKERTHLFQRTNIAVEIGDIIGRVSTFIGIQTEGT
jgi:hypothetical protein